METELREFLTGITLFHIQFGQSFGLHLQNINSGNKLFQKYLWKRACYSVTSLRHYSISSSYRFLQHGKENYNAIHVKHKRQLTYSFSKYIQQAKNKCLLNVCFIVLQTYFSIDTISFCLLLASIFSFPHFLNAWIPY